MRLVSFNAKRGVFVHRKSWYDVTVVVVVVALEKSILRNRCIT